MIAPMYIRITPHGRTWKMALTETIGDNYILRAHVRHQVRPSLAFPRDIRFGGFGRIALRNCSQKLLQPLLFQWQLFRSTRTFLAALSRMSTGLSRRSITDGTPIDVTAGGPCLAAVRAALGFAIINLGVRYGRRRTGPTAYEREDAGGRSCCSLGHRVR